VLDEPLDWRFRSFPQTDAVVTTRSLKEQDWNVLRGDLLLPALVLHDDALQHNIDVMADYTRARGLSFAPHAKTTMAPQIVQRQLAAGAWAITVATASQARVMRRFGVPRILLANELVDVAALRWLADELRRDESFEFSCLVDSLAGVESMTRAWRELGEQRPIDVLLEVGYVDGRSGCRNMDELRGLARAITSSETLSLVGLEAFEGFVGSDAGSERVAKDAVVTFLQGFRAAAEALADDGQFGGDEIVLSAGGSAHFDVVADVLGNEPVPGRKTRVVLRSGCYVTHDSGFYQRCSPLGSSADGVPEDERLRPALELWASVLSTPQPGLAIAGFGKRDAAYDVELPRPLHVFRDGRFVDLAPATRVTKLDDQHAYIALSNEDELHVGELLACGLSHPCAAFDKWRVIPVVDSAYTVKDAVWVFV
jgi:D-serine dehydratase